MFNYLGGLLGYGDTAKQPSPRRRRSGAISPSRRRPAAPAVAPSSPVRRRAAAVSPSRRPPSPVRQRRPITPSPSPMGARVTVASRTRARIRANQYVTTVVPLRRASPLYGHSIVVKTPEAATPSPYERLALSSYFDDMPADSISAISTHRACGRPTKEDADFFKGLDVLFASGGSEKGSASASVVIGAIIDAAPGRPRVFIKMAFGTERDALYYERIIYCKVTIPLLTRLVTPCIVPYLGYVLLRNALGACDSRATRRGTAVVPRLAKVCEAIEKARHEKNGENYSIFAPSRTTHAHALITEMSQGEKLLEDGKGWMAKGRSQSDYAEVRCNLRADVQITLTRQPQVFFQVVFTLAAFVEIGLVHADLHTGNVFVDESARGVESSIWVVGPNKFRLMRTRWLPKIYDFDRSYKIASPYEGFREAIVNHAIIDPDSFYVTFHGADQSKIDPRMDYARLITYMNIDAATRILLPQRFASALHATFSSDLVKDYEQTGLSWHGTLCYSSRAGKPCVIDPSRSERLCMSPRQVLSSENPDLIGEIVDEQEARRFFQRESLTASRVYHLPSAAATRDSFLRHVGVAATTTAASAATRSRTQPAMSTTAVAPVSTMRSSIGRRR